VQNSSGFWPLSATFFLFTKKNLEKKSKSQEGSVRTGFGVARSESYKGRVRGIKINVFKIIFEIFSQNMFFLVFFYKYIYNYKSSHENFSDQMKGAALLPPCGSAIGSAYCEIHLSVSSGSKMK
jgi:hypothetical protein